MTPVKLKVCGITSFDDAAAAVDCGATYLGFNFYRPSPRYIEPAAAREIIEQLPSHIVSVGVFVNEEVKVVRDLMDGCGLTLAQLHGDETAAYCLELARPAVKALRIKDRGGFLALAEFQGRAGIRGFLLDAYADDAYGGTGRTVDWTLAAEAARSASVLLAGGLTPENVAEAIRAVRPYGVDVSSGVEVSPGKKDPEKIRRFIQSARQAFAI